MMGRGSVHTTHHGMCNLVYCQVSVVKLIFTSQRTIQRGKQSFKGSDQSEMDNVIKWII